MAECLVHTRDALVPLARIAWDTDFNASDIDAIRSEQVRRYLSRAAEAVSQDDIPGAVGWIRAGFEYALQNGGENLVGPTVRVKSFAVHDRGGSSRSENPDPFRRGEGAAVAFSRLQILGRLTAFSMNIREYLHWRNRLSSAPTLNIRDELTRYENEASWTVDDYNAALAYVVDSVLKMEQVVDDVDPGGFTRGGFDKL